MHRPFIALLFAVSFVLASCTPYPTDDPYGYGQRPPRYGHGGTDSPQNANQPWKRNQQQQQQVPGADQGQMGNQTGTGTDPAAAGTDTGADTTGAGPVATDPNTTDAGTAAQTGADDKPATPASDKPKYGTPVPGKPGFLYSPHNPDGGYIDIRVKNADGSMGTLPPGTKIKDPFSSNAILVP